MKLFALTVALLASSLSCPAEIYQWKDADGRTVFSERAPVNVDAIIVKPKTTPASAEAIEKLKKQLAPKPPEEAPNEEVTAAPEPAAKEKKVNCEKSRRVLTQLENSGRVRHTRDDGEIAYLTEEERQQRIEDAQTSVSTWCN